MGGVPPRTRCGRIMCSGKINTTWYCFSPKGCSFGLKSGDHIDETSFEWPAHFLYNAVEVNKEKVCGGRSGVGDHCRPCTYSAAGDVGAALNRQKRGEKEKMDQRWKLQKPKGTQKFTDAIYFKSEVRSVWWLWKRRQAPAVIINIGSGSSWLLTLMTQGPLQSTEIKHITQWRKSKQLRLLQ